MENLLLNIIVFNNKPIRTLLRNILFPVFFKHCLHKDKKTFSHVRSFLH